MSSTIRSDFRGQAHTQESVSFQPVIIDTDTYPNLLHPAANAPCQESCQRCHLSVWLIQCTSRFFAALGFHIVLTRSDFVDTHSTGVVVTTSLFAARFLTQWLVAKLCL